MKEFLVRFNDGTTMWIMAENEAEALRKAREMSMED